MHRFVDKYFSSFIYKTLPLKLFCCYITSSPGWVFSQACYDHFLSWGGGGAKKKNGKEFLGKLK